MFEYPPHARCDRPLPKNRIYAHAKPTRAVRDRFIREIDEIVWRYNLAPEIVNLPGTAAVQQIQIFEITLKVPQVSEDVLRTMDRAIPSQVFFELRHGDQVCFACTYKRPSQTEPSKPVVDVYFKTPWVAADAPRSGLPVALDLLRLYEQMLYRHIEASDLGLARRPAEELEALLARAAQIRALERTCQKLERQLQQEFQFNRKVEINAELRASRAELAQLKQ